MVVGLSHRGSRFAIICGCHNVTTYRICEEKPCIFIIFGMDKNQNYDAETSLADI